MPAWTFIWIGGGVVLGLLCSTVEVFVCLFATPVWFACGKLTLNYLKKK